ncbi:MAG: hypothetical protein K1X74_22855, partial [Pirellulales bacterium]|nr:hypothetical protein [Pirellulales bacterium]
MDRVTTDNLSFRLPLLDLPSRGTSPVAPVLPPAGESSPSFQRQLDSATQSATPAPAKEPEPVAASSPSASAPPPAAKRRESEEEHPASDPEDPTAVVPADAHLPNAPAESSLAQEDDGSQAVAPLEESTAKPRSAKGKRGAAQADEGQLKKVPVEAQVETSPDARSGAAESPARDAEQSLAGATKAEETVAKAQPVAQTGKPAASAGKSSPGPTAAVQPTSDVANDASTKNSDTEANAQPVADPTGEISAVTADAAVSDPAAQTAATAAAGEQVKPAAVNSSRAQRSANERTTARQGQSADDTKQTAPETKP